MEDIILSHGSRQGIKGNIQPISRIHCDFGAGFYMGTNSNQVSSLVANEKNPVFYKMKVSLSQFPENRILLLDGIEWAYYVAYNRGKFEDLKNTKFYNQQSALATDKDFIVGPIADDNMNEVMKMFMDAQITDVAMCECIKAINYGTQYVAKTERGCSAIEVVESIPISKEERKRFIEYSRDKRKDSDSIVAGIIRQNRRNGLFLDEVMEQFLRQG